MSVSGRDYRRKRHYFCYGHTDQQQHDGIICYAAVSAEQQITKYGTWIV